MGLINWFRWVFIVSGILASFQTHAFRPEAAVWSFTSEVNGQPGRGIEIDVQGASMVLVLYGYRQSGEGTFHLASGTLAGNTMSATMYAFRGGRYLGGPSKSAVVDSSPGSLKVTFTSATKGTITLPGEAPSPIERMNFGWPKGERSLDGVYNLTRATVDLPSSALRYDTESNFAATGSMVIDGTSANQAFQMIINGSSQSGQISATFTDLGHAINTISTAGARSYVHLIQRGDVVITLVATPQASEVDYWERVSTNPKGLLATEVRSAMEVTPAVAEGPIGTLGHNILMTNTDSFRDIAH